MFFQIIVSIVLGVFLGVITGLIPGIHVNLVTVLLVSIYPKLIGYFSTIQIVCAILSLAVTHSFLDTIPSTFLGTPEEDTALSILPAHKLLLEGKGYEAVMLTVFGSYFGLIFSLLLIPILFQILVPIYSVISAYIGQILVAIALTLIFKENKKILAGVLFLISGILGTLVFRLEIEQVLFPLFTGLFGTSTLILSLHNKTNIPSQTFEITTKIKANKEIILSVIIGWVASFLPGLGSSQAAVFGSWFSKGNSRNFLVMIGGLSTVNMVLSILTLFLLGKARNGAVVGISELISLDVKSFVLLICVILITGGISVGLSIYLVKKFAKLVTKIKYAYLCLCILGFIIILVGIITKSIGMFILIVSTCLGIIPQLKGVSRSQLMGCLLIPVIIHFI
jgi:putative membrane protein